jgi:mono/diheme cytochrome c family protein
VRTAVLLLSLLLLGGCEKLARNMYEQPRFAPVAPVPGTVATDARPELEDAKTNPLPVTMALLQHGRERFDVYCAPCHSPVGDGDGRVARRGFPHPPSYHIDRLRNAPDRHFFDVMTKGYGVMRPYADRVPPEDRWAIVAYIRALQLSQHAPLADSK